MEEKELWLLNTTKKVLYYMTHYEKENNYQKSKNVTKLNTLIHRHQKCLANNDLTSQPMLIARLYSSTVSSKSKLLRMHVNNLL